MRDTLNPGISQALGRFVVDTHGCGFFDITSRLKAWLEGRLCADGLLTLFVRHTSASLTIQENADPDVRTDLVAALSRLAPEGRHWLHAAEGPDDMPAHVKAMLTGINLAIPVEAGRMLLGTWQAVYLIEHRTQPHRREIAAHFLGTFRPPSR